MTATSGSTFKDQELAGWNAKADAYDAYAARITRQIIPSLLDAAGVLVNKSSVRTAMVLELQASDALPRIHEAILSGLARFKHEDGYRIAWPAVIAAARKPAP